MGILIGNAFSNNYVIFQGHVDFQGCILIKYQKSVKNQIKHNIYGRKHEKIPYYHPYRSIPLTKKQSFIPNPPHLHPPPHKKKTTNTVSLNWPTSSFPLHFSINLFNFCFSKLPRLPKMWRLVWPIRSHSLQWCHCVGCGCWAAGKKVKRQHERNTHGALGLVTLGELGSVDSLVRRRRGYKIGTRILQQLEVGLNKNSTYIVGVKKSICYYANYMGF